MTREYLLNYRRDRHLVRSETFSDLAALERAMTTIEELELFEIGGRKPYKLKVRVKADLARGWVMYVIPWEVSTRWRGGNGLPCLHSGQLCGSAAPKRAAP